MLHFTREYTQPLKESDDLDVILFQIYYGTVYNTNDYSHIQCESKKSSPLKLFAIFSLVVNLCN